MARKQVPGQINTDGKIDDPLVEMFDIRPFEGDRVVGFFRSRKHASRETTLIGGVKEDGSTWVTPDQGSLHPPEHEAAKRVLYKILGG